MPLYVWKSADSILSEYMLSSNTGLCCEHKRAVIDLYLNDIKQVDEIFYVETYKAG